ncbi:MAG TPA: hypothetical protein VFC37_03260 [Terracidiphilus sp.]|nr:hypothetical protein [Terracidiphilus sp.]
MKNLLWIPIALVLLPAAARTQSLPDAPSPAPPNADNWARLASLSRGDEITVDTGGKHVMHCSFGSATDEYLFCAPRYDGLRRGELRIDRADVETVRQVHEVRNRWLLVAAMASAGGIAVGLLRQDLDTRGQVELSVASAASFGFLGYPIARLAAHFIPGSILYRHSGSAHGMPLPQAPAQ